MFLGKTLYFYSAFVHLGIQMVLANFPAGVTLQWNCISEGVSHLGTFFIIGKLSFSLIAET